MTRSLVAGIALAIGAVLTFTLGGVVGPELQAVALLGLAAGGALGLVPDATPGRRAGAFALGLLAAWVGYLLRAVALPDATSGRLAALVAVVLACTAVAALSSGRLPLWSALLGAGVLAGAYETVYVESPPDFLTSSPAQATAVLVAVGVGFAATVLLEPARTRTAAHPVLGDDSPSSAPAFRPLDTVPEA